MEAVSDMPVQRCLAGEEMRTMADYEILAVLLGTGSRKRDVMEVSFNIVRRLGGIRGIASSGIRELAELEGIGPFRAVRIQAALELGRRAAGDGDSGNSVDTPSRVWNLLLPDIIGRQQEAFYALMLDNKNRLIRKKVVSLGTVSEALIHPREIFRDAVRESASSVIIAHNHPSGDLTPSREDVAATKRIGEAGRIIGIELLDHLILSTASFLSLRESGHWNFQPEEKAR